MFSQLHIKYYFLKFQNVLKYQKFLVVMEQSLGGLSEECRNTIENNDFPPSFLQVQECNQGQAGELLDNVNVSRENLYV